MNTCYILATGPSMDQETADAVRVKGVVLAVSDAHRLAPWADALCSTDISWWIYHEDDVHYFKGRRVCSQWNGNSHTPPGSLSNENSTVLAIRTARAYYKPDRIVLLGVDFHGTHFFGKHPKPLSNTKPERWSVFQRQFDRQLLECRKEGIELVNATPGSRLMNVPRVRLEDL